MTKKAFAKIYGIADQEGRIMYIGKANDPTKRMKQHIRECRRRKTPLYGWINKCLEHGFQPQMIVLASAISEDWQSLETQVIAQYRKQSHMLNIANGGDQPKSNPTTNKQNAYALNAKFKAAPMLKRIRELKRSMAKFLKDCDKGLINIEMAKRIKDKLRYAGNKNPQLFGEYIYL